MTSKKVNKHENVFVERILPAEGDIVSKPGDLVEPFTKLGTTKVSYGRLEVGPSLKITKGKGVGGYFYLGDVIGRINRKDVTAPFDGYLEKTDTGYLLRQEKRDFWLLAGVWGEVKEVVDKKAVLIGTKMMDLGFAVCTKGSYAGEFVVFPNPSELLEMQYLEKFEKDTFGKVIYLGDFANAEVVARAVELGVGGIIAGSIDRNTISIAKENGVFLGVFSGFGHIPTPDFIFNELKEVSNRYVFVQGERRLLRIPLPRDYKIDEDKGEFLRNLDKGLRVQLLDRKNFGLVGVIESVQKDEVYVILDGSKKTVKVHVASIIALE